MFQRSIITAAFLGMISTSAVSGSPVDTILLGDPDSEKLHGLDAEFSEIIDGGLGIKARRFLPRDEESWRGGNAAFKMAVDPEKPNYCTVKLWGGYTNEVAGRMMLFIEGKQVGQRHLGEIDQLDIAGSKPRFAGRFFYKTIPLPVTETRGREKVELSIEAQGDVWAYGPSFERFQHAMKSPSRGVYRMYTHTESFFEPPADDPQGEAVPAPPIRKDDDEHVLELVKERVNNALVDLMKKEDDNYSQEQLAFMARAYHEPWTKAYCSKKMVERIASGVDYQYRVYNGDEDKKFDWKSDWSGFGLTADAVRLLKKELKPHLNDRITGKKTLRKKGWVKMFADCRDEHVVRRRSYTNQSMILDTFGIYLCNRGVAAIDPFKAWPEKEAMQFMYESMGLEPWSGSRKSAKGSPTWRLGEEYMLLTEAGLTKELGYVGAYGEVIDWASKMYDATRPAYGAEGDPRIKAQLAKISRARAPFRYPGRDSKGYRVMFLEAPIGWRDFKFPGQIVYDQIASRESIPFDAAAATLDPVLIGYAQHMLEENQYFAELEHLLEDKRFQTTAILLGVPGTYETVLKQPDQPTRLPMAIGQPDFVFSDPGNGVIALKNGDEILYASLYWRARYAINNLAKIHHLTPTIEREATVWQRTDFNDSGKTFEMPDQVNAPFSTKFERDYRDGGLGSSLAEAGIEQPIAVVPDMFKDYQPGKENIHAGKGTFYLLNYGSYLVAMNCTKDQSFDFEVPEEFRGAEDLVTGQIVDSPVSTAQPWQTIIRFRE